MTEKESLPHGDIMKIDTEGAPAPDSTSAAAGDSVRWGVWCRPRAPYLRDPCGGAIIRAMFAEGPDGVLCLFETTARHLAEHFNTTLPTWEHEARRLDDPGEPNEAEYDND